ncbi:MAG: DUF4115 domain-containing protein [Gammaproteobacteria bacterium]|nr:DUF4115 domain-containing protein [Gammaproteobacteria bacterium]
MADGRSDDPIDDEPTHDEPVTDAEPAEAEEEAGDARESEDIAGSGVGMPGPGARLRAARESRGLDQDELARALNLSRRVVRALEEDDEKQLPGATFVRGYIRSWARLTEEPAEPLLAAYEARADRPGPTIQPTPSLEPVSPGPVVLRHRPGLVMTVVTLILVVAAAMVLFGIWPDAPDRSSPGAADGTSGAVEDDRPAPQRPVTSLQPEAGPSAPPGESGEGAAAGSSAAESGLPGTEVPVAEVPVAEPSVAEVPVSESSGSELPATDDPATEDPVAADVATEVSTDGSATRVLAGGDAHLHLVFRGDCWVEIRDRDDRVVHRDLHRAGQVLDVLGRAPFRVRLGYALAVELSCNRSAGAAGTPSRATMSHRW